MIKELEGQIPINFLCKNLNVCRSSFYYWKQERKLVSLERKESICLKIKSIFEASKGTYGSPRVYHELKEQRVLVSENTVACYMREMGLSAGLKRKFRVQTTDSNHSFPIASRLFKTEEEETFPENPGEVLVGDITYLRFGDKFIYLAIVMDLFNREIIGWSMKDSLHTQVVLDALDMAMRKVGPDAEIIFHSDRGSQYASIAYRNFLKEHHVIPSMSRKGNCYDNAYAESWFASLKKEWIYRSEYSTKKELRSLVFEYIETWYNTKRKHSALDYKSPKEYKKMRASTEKKVS